jgi:hypothetical protein
MPSEVTGQIEKRTPDAGQSLGTGIGGTPAAHFRCGQRRLHRVLLVFRCDLDHCETVEVQPAFVLRRNIQQIRRYLALAHNASLPSVLLSGDSPIENRLASGAISQVGVCVLAGD